MKLQVIRVQDMQKFIKSFSLLSRVLIVLLILFEYFFFCPATPKELTNEFLKKIGWLPKIGGKIDT